MRTTNRRLSVILLSCVLGLAALLSAPAVAGAVPAGPTDAGATKAGLAPAGPDEAARIAGEGCTAAPFGYVCGIIGTPGGKRIINAQVSRGKADASLICNHHGTFTIYSGNRVIHTKTSARHTGCTPLRAYHGWNFNMRWPTATRACVSFFENRVRQGTVCQTVR